ncbi:hypothetical protein LPC10_22195 [Methylorubrum sp. B1-46]|uniref:hypothetical protein n=1 Tax=Methylorubrum sp. B1-46 TaxID=2897334 RepID=UPI001E3B51B6|nr:hypothetical protein [Methylorubrum sp. B1-46]UGB25568.1 hypothetical protein LPC10_22195 [Methylorubrum sp. B1-46]
MPRQPKATQAAITRAVKGALAAGLKVGRVEIDGNRIVVHPSEDVRPEPASELDAWRAKRNAR